MKNFIDRLSIFFQKFDVKKWRKQKPVIFWLTSGFISLAILGFCFYSYVAYLMPLPDLFSTHADSATTKIFDRNGVLLYEILQPESGKKTFIPLSQIPKNFVQATLAAEDIHFYEHGGVDWFAILRAVFFNVREQRVVSGGSTIPQQLIRNLLGFQRDRGYSDKILEAFYAVRLSHLYSKDQILELYLNKIYYGNLAYGSDSAAMDYFGKPLFHLDLAQSALLAGLPQAPSAYNPFLYFDKAKKRQQYVLQQMVKYHFITQQDADGAFAEPLHFRHNVVSMKAPHFVQYILNQVADQFGDQMVSHGGLSITTTLDYNLQLQAEQIISNQVKLLHDKHVTNGALLSLDPHTGQILAWVGSENYFDETIDGAVDMVNALRQPGSSIKPLTYLAAFEKGFTPATILDDIPTEFATSEGPYAPKNYDLRFHGPVRARNALASSFNVPAVKVLDYVGVAPFILFLQKLGITTLEQNADFYGLALTLGGGEVRMYDMARAFNVIANYGEKRDLSGILKITQGDGESTQKSSSKTLYEWKLPEAQYILGEHGREHAYQVIDILKDPLARLGGFGEGSALEISHEAAVKTGTTRNFRDNWTIGFTPQILTAVWVGNADATAMQNISGIDGAGPIWHDFMEAAHKFLPRVSFAKPSNLKQTEICALSGKLPTDLCLERVFEWFVPGTEPQEQDDYYRKFWIDTSSGHIIQDACAQDYIHQRPSSSIQQKTFVAYPSKFQKWALGERLSLPPIEPCNGSGYPSGYSGDQSGDYSNVHPRDHANTGSGLSSEEQKSAPSVTIDSPNSHDEFMMNPGLPLKDQKIPFRVTVPLDTTTVKFFVDEKLAATVSMAPFSYLWLPIKGVHHLKVEAIMADGKLIKSQEVLFEIH